MAAHDGGEAGQFRRPHRQAASDDTRVLVVHVQASQVWRRQLSPSGCWPPVAPHRLQVCRFFFRESYLAQLAAQGRPVREGEAGRGFIRDLETTDLKS